MAHLTEILIFLWFGGFLVWTAGNEPDPTESRAGATRVA